MAITSDPHPPFKDTCSNGAFIDDMLGLIYALAGCRIEALDASICLLDGGYRYFRIERYRY